MLDLLDLVIHRLADAGIMVLLDLVKKNKQTNMNE